MVYGKLELNAPEGSNASLLQISGKFALKLFQLSLLVCAVCLLVKIVILNTAPRTYLLTDIPSIGEENGMKIAFWFSLFVSFFAAQAKSTTWFKKLLQIFGFLFASMVMGMLVLMTLDDFAERRLFGSVNAPFNTEPFSAVSIDFGRKGNRKVAVSSPKYKRQPSIWIEHSAYDFLQNHKIREKDDIPQASESLRSNAPSKCVDLPVQHSGAHARVRLDQRLTIRDFYNCR